MASGQAHHVLRHVWTSLAAHEADQLSDRDLLRRFHLQRDESAFTALVRRHGPMVLGVCRRVLPNPHDAEDAFQATFLVLARRASAIHKRAALGSWPHGVAYHIATTARTSDARRRQRESRAGERRTEEPDRSAAWRELQETLDAELHQLPEKLRSPLILSYLEGQTHEEAAQQLGWPVGTVKSRLARARELLRERLTARGLALSASAFAAALAVNAAGAALPIRLARTTAQAAVAFAGRQAELQVPARATALAETLLRATAPGRLWLPALLVMSVVMIGSSVGYQLATTGQKTEPERKQPPPAEIAEYRQARTDRFGDPLPDEAIARLGTRRFWCGSTGIQIAYSSDGAKILVANWDSVHVIDARTGQQLRHIRPLGAAAINSVSLSPDGKLLALGTDSHAADTESCNLIFDMLSGQLLRRCKDTGRQQYLHVCFSPDGKLLGSYSYPSKTIYLWDPATAQEVRRWPVECETTSCFVFPRDSKTVIVGDGATIHFWTVSDGKETQRIEGHPDVVYQLALSSDGKTLASRGLKRRVQVGEFERDNKLCLWDTATGKKLHQIEVVTEATRQAKHAGQDASAITYHDFAPDGRTVVTASGDGILRVWDCATGNALRRWDTAGWVGGFAFAPDGKILAALGSGHTVYLWDPATGKEVRDHPGHPPGFQFLALSPDGAMVASAGYGQDVRLWDTSSGREPHRFRAAGAEVRAVAFNPDGRAVLALGEDGKLYCWDVATHKELRQITTPVEGYQRWYAFSPHGKLWASVAGPKGDVIVLWDSANGQLVRDFVADQGWVGALGFGPNGRSLYSWGWEKKVRVWDVTTGEKRREFPTEVHDRLYTGSFSPSGKWFACGGRGRSAARVRDGDRTRVDPSWNPHLVPHQSELRVLAR